MSDEPLDLGEEIKSKRGFESERTIGVFRLAVGVVCGAVYLVFADTGMMVPRLFWTIFLVGVGYSLWNIFGKPLRRFLWLRWIPVATSIKATLLMLLLYATGGTESPLFGVAYLAVVLVALRSTPRETFVAGVIYGFAYITLALGMQQFELHLTAILIRIALLVLTAAMAGLMSHQMVRQRVEEELRKRLVERIIHVQDAERRHIARELHDETGQALASLIVGLRALEEAKSIDVVHKHAKRLRRAAESTVGDVARLSRGLHPSAIDDLGFSVAIERFVEDYAEAHGIHADVCVRGCEAKDLPLPVATTLYRIVQEALTNVAKHARAETVSILIDRNREHVRAVVEDDGCGFEPNGAPARHGLGLQGIRERLSLIQGSLNIESSPGSGTTLAIHVPLGEAA